MKMIKMTCGGALLCAMLNLTPASAADDTNSPAVTTTVPATNAPAHNRGAPMTAAEQAEVAKLADLPAWTPGDGDGDYSIGPTYAPAPEATNRDDVPKGRVESFTLNAADSKFYTGTGIRGAAPTRKVTVYIPSQYVPGTPAPLIVSCDAYGARSNQLATILDNMIADHRLPAIVAVMIANGGGSERSIEYDTVSGKYAEFVEAEILPKVEKDYGVTITKDPDGRMTLGGSSGGVSAFTMAWFHPELYHRVLAYSASLANLQSGPDAPHGAWEYHDHIVAQSPVKPLRLWLEVGQHDVGATNAAAGFRNWVIANQRMAGVLKDKGYHYQLVYAKGAGHTDGKVISQTYPQALEYVWQGYKPVTN